MYTSGQCLRRSIFELSKDQEGQSKYHYQNVDRPDQTKRYAAIDRSAYLRFLTFANFRIWQTDTAHTHLFALMPSSVSLV